LLAAQQILQMRLNSTPELQDSGKNKTKQAFLGGI